MEPFSRNGYLEKNLEALYQHRIEKQNKDVTILVCGAPGNGKSALTWFAAQYLASNIDKIGFSWEDVAFTHKQWIDNEKENLAKYDVSWYDEGYNTFYARNAMTNENKEGKSHLNQYRFKHHYRFINFQDITNIEKDLLFSAEIGVQLLLRCVKQGWLHGYSQQSIQGVEIEKDGGVKSVKWPDPDFRDGWPDPENRMPDKWGEYERLNEEKVKQDEEDEQESDDGLTVKEMAKVVKTKQDRYKKKYRGRQYLDLDLIQVDFDIGNRIGKKVKKLAEADLGIG